MTPASRSYWHRLPWRQISIWGAPAVIGLLSLLHALQFASPLRLNTDAIRFLHLAWVHADTGDFPPEQLPLGYPLVISSLIQSGLTGRISLIIFNYIAFATGLFLTVILVKRATSWSRNQAYGLVIIFLLSWTVIKHAAIPLSEPLYFALSTGALLCAVKANTAYDFRHSFLYYEAAIVLGYLSLEVRSIGIAAVLAIMFACVLELFGFGKERTLHKQRNSIRARACFLAPIITGLTLLTLGITEQLNRPGSYWQHSALSLSAEERVIRTLAIWQTRANELGALVLNVPQSAIPDASRSILTLVGAVGAGFVIRGCFRQFQHLPAITVYVLFYALILLNWPYEDARFWLPILPLLAILGLSGIHSTLSERWFAGFRSLASIEFAAMGVLAIGYSVHLTFSGASFPLRYTSGSLLSSYRATIEHHAYPDADPLAIEVLNHYFPVNLDHRVTP